GRRSGRMAMLSGRSKSGIREVIAESHQERNAESTQYRVIPARAGIPVAADVNGDTRFRGNDGWRALAQIGFRKFVIGQPVEEIAHIVRAAIAEIDIVRVFPNIQAEQHLAFAGSE